MGGGADGGKVTKTCLWVAVGNECGAIAFSRIDVLGAAAL